MTIPIAILAGASADDAAYVWLGRVLTNFAIAEQAIGKLCVRLELPISNGSLASIAVLRDRLRASDDPKCRAFEKRIARWNANRPYRHLLAHATIIHLDDKSGLLVTRIQPLDASDVTPDRVWTAEERVELLRQATNDGRSISDHANGLISDPVRLAKLRRA